MVRWYVVQDVVKYLIIVNVKKVVIMTIREKISDYFAGIVTHEISVEEQNKHNILLQKVVCQRNARIRVGAKKLREVSNG